ncbi:Carboxypeptidase A2 [Holothuria leucospilota]|uniref:Carboxypeptidase A2 n=1 Tax=Holothuria leucospilota TaxID=206669 RepID=A0A9Q1CGT7_HOLLE|nr:Carboxypeptidase A2 [Holothuria leucospilota]
MKMHALFVFAAVVAIAAAGEYSGYQTLRITPRSQADLKVLRDFERESTLLDFWQSTKSLQKTVDILVPPALSTDVKDFLENHGIEFRIGIQDVQQLIDLQAEERKNSVQSTAGFDYYRYNTYEEIRQWVYDFAAEHSDLISVHDVAESFEGRPIALMKIGNPRQDGTVKKAVYYQGGIHAREWLSPATVILIIKQMVEGYEAGDNDVKLLLDTFDYYIVPQLNADGYDYTWKQPQFRLWRKNRHTFEDKLCDGVDLNRNYPVGFGAGNGASGITCGYTYHGEGPFSEKELFDISVYLNNLKDVDGVEFVHFIDFHTYSQLLLGPWSYSDSVPDPPDVVDQTAAGDAAAQALAAVDGCTYTVGPSAKTLYEAAGCSNDWGYHSEMGLNAKYSYVMELRDEGEYGFLIPDSYIDVSGRETYEAVKAFGAWILAEYGN